MARSTRPHRVSRRRFLQSAAVAGAAASLPLGLPGLAQSTGSIAALPYPENGTLIPDDGWHLWLDRDAKWMQDDIFLPEDVKWFDGSLCGNGVPLPANVPTGGWEALRRASAKVVILPTTVEQHFWGVSGKRPYTPEEYRYAPANPPLSPADDDVPQNGAYFGVSWWYREIDIPLAMLGKRIFLNIRGARLRAEVYLNEKLVGYSIMEELPFECDLTDAAKPGSENQLAIRLTNPFGRFDWVDGLNAKWGHAALYRSHGFAGLDRGLTLSAHNPERIASAWVLNRLEQRSIECFFTLDKLTSDPRPEIRGKMALEVIDPANGTVLRTEREGLETNTHYLTNDTKRRIVHYEDFNSVRISGVSGVELWDLDHPKIYHLRFSWTSANGETDVRVIPFGFRTFVPSGLGTDAMFRLNGRRIKIYSSISWGFWGLNGLFPTPELAEKEVTQAKKLNLNCLNFHRNLAKVDVLRAHDRLGLLRYMEPGAGKMAIGKLPSGAQANSAGIVMEKPTSFADKFAQRYMFVKCVEMVKAYRSHPSLIEYCLQNEIGADLKNPDTIAVLQAMRDEDPSRCIVLNDGFVAPPRKAAQAWFAPYDPKLHRSDGEPWGGWWNQHQGAGDQWYDSFYKSPADFTYKSPEHKVISEFGEMEGCATPDNHSLMVHQVEQTFRQYGGTSYDLADHQEIIAATDKFLDKWDFRRAFPATELLWNALGEKCYETWQNYLENARISDDLDFAVISGWESTSIENHSGIVDNLRNFKSDPAPISQALQPVHPIAKQRSTCIALGESALFDLYLLNDTGKNSTGKLVFSMVTPSGKKIDLKTLDAPPQTPDVFSYLLVEGFETPKLTETGLYRFKFSISSAPLATQTKDIWVTSTSRASSRPVRIGVSGVSPALRKQLERLQAVTVFDFSPGKACDVIVSAGLTLHTSADQNVGETTGLEAVPPVVKPGHAPEPGEEPVTQQLGHLQHGIVEAVQRGTPLLAIPQANTLSDGVAKQLAEAGAFSYAGNVGDFRAPWMGNWYFVREHALFAGMPVNQAMGMFYQAKGRQSNGLLVNHSPAGSNVEVVVGYSRDHDRQVGAGTFTAKLGPAKIVFHRTPEFHPVLQQRFLANTLDWLTKA